MERTKVSDHIKLNVVVLVLFVTALATFATGCTSLERSMSSGYAYNPRTSDQVTAQEDRAYYERESARNELGLVSNEKSIAYRQTLKRYERELEGRAEKEQYYRAKPLLKNDGERLRFLGLGSTTKRDRYLASVGIDGDNITHPPEVQQLIDENDIAAGMTKQAVRESWGAPDGVEVAGNPMYGNEQWHYTEQVTSSEGYMTEKRVVYFEGGRVVGWETAK